MPATMQELGIDQWSVRERIRLIDDIEASLGVEGTDEPFDCVSVPDWHRAVITLRLREMQDNHASVIPWREAMDRVWNGP